jgi:hypothetical protein
MTSPKLDEAAIFNKVGDHRGGLKMPLRFMA